jgi:hypothetical protein
MPVVGGSVTVHYLGSTMSGIVRGVHDEARRLEVETEDGRMETFLLNRATATFTSAGSQVGARLRFPARDPP